MATKQKVNVLNAGKPAKSATGEKRAASPVNVDDANEVPAKKMDAGKAAFMSMLQKQGRVPAIVKRSTNGALPMVTVRGVVVSTKITSVPGKAEGQMVPKMDFVLISNAVNVNGAPDCVDTGLPGVAYLLPTQKGVSAPTQNGAEDGPEAAVANKGKGKDGKDKKQSAPPRTLALPEGHKAISTFCIRTSVFITPPGGGNADEDKEKDAKPKMNVDAIQPGAVVNVTGLVANIGLDGKTLWLNARDITPLRPPIQTGDEIKTIMSEFMTKESAFSSAFFASVAMNGFFGTDFGADDALEEQAKVFHCMWTAFLQQTSKSCEHLANTLTASGEDKQNVDMLNSHAARLASTTSPADAASASSFVFLPTQMPTADHPLYCAPLVQKDKFPGMPGPGIIMDLVERNPDKLHSIPRTFAALDVQFVEIKGAAIRLQCVLWFVGDKEAAVKQLENGKNPILSSGASPVLGISLSMRSFCATLGVLVKSKAEMVAKQLLIDADMAVVAEVNSKDPNSNELGCPFPRTPVMVDMPSSISKFCIPVTESWVQANLCGGATQHVYEDDDTVEKITEKDGRTTVMMKDPSLRNGYQAISECSFKFGLSKTPVDKPIKKYFVAYEGSRDAIAEHGSLSTHDGEKLIEKVASEKKSELYEFLTSEAVVYCVASAE